MTMRYIHTSVNGVRHLIDERGRCATCGRRHRADVCPSVNDAGVGCVHDAGHTGRHHGVGASWPQPQPEPDSFGAWLDRQRCVECGDRATHRDGAATVCNKHMTNDARALND